MGDRVVIGVGNAMGGDDAAGILVAEALRSRGLDAVVSDGEPSRLMTAWEGADLAVVVDAVSAGGETGSVVIVDATDEPLPTGLRMASSHHLGVAEVVELARALDRLPRRLVVVGVEGGAFGVGAETSKPVLAGVGAAADAVEGILADA